MPLVTVVIPVYNVQKYLPECMDSVLAQTLEDIEVLCIDDASPDRCGEILDQYARKDPRVRVFHLPENKKQGHGRNIGIDNAQGKYIYFLDSDDMIAPETLKDLSFIAERDALDVIAFDYKCIYESPALKINFPPHAPRKGVYPKTVCTGSDLFDDLMRQGEYTCLPPIYFWRTGMLRDQNLRFPEGSEHEDEYFAFAGLLTAVRARYVPRQYFLRQYRSGSVVTSKQGPRNFHGALMTYWLMNAFCSERNIHTYASDQEIAIMYGMCRQHYASLDHEALRAYCRNPDELKIYECVTSAIKAQDCWYVYGTDTIGEIRRAKAFDVFGTGKTAERLGEALRVMGCEPRYYLVSGEKDAPAIFLGRPVVPLEAYVPTEDALVVLSVRKEIAPEIGKLLTERGIRWIYDVRPKVHKSELRKKASRLFRLFQK